MPFRNTSDQYGAMAKFFHWSIAFLVIGLLPVGLFMGGMENSPLKFEIYAMHKSFGLLVLFLGLARIGWRINSPAPKHLPHHKPWERALAFASHLWLYVCVIGMPMTGWLMSSASQFPVPFFGLRMPHIIGKDERLGELFYQAHETLAYTLLFVLALHAAGALKHHVIDRDETLQRMSWRSAGIGFAALIILILGASYTLSGLSILKRYGDVAEEEQAVLPVAAEKSVRVPLQAHGWTIVPEESRLTFTAMLYGSAFEGEFGAFGGMIVFNPADLTTATADITIDMRDVKTGDADRDASLAGQDWFNIADYPESRFVASTFERTGGDGYLAIGDLVIRGVSMPVKLPFTLNIDGKRAHMTADVTLNRLDFGIGTGEWEDDKAVGHSVNVHIDLTAVQ